MFWFHPLILGASFPITNTNTMSHPKKKCFVELPPEDYQSRDEHMCGLLQYSLYGTDDAAENWEEEMASTLSALILTSAEAASRANTVWQLVDGDDITIGGERSVVEFLSK